MKTIATTLLLLFLFAGCAVTYRFPKTPEPKMDGGEVIHYRLGSKGEAMTLYPDKGPEQEALLFYPGPELSVKTGIASDPETRVSGQFRLEEKATGRQLLVLASARYPEAFFQGEYDVLTRANGDFALLDGERSVGLITYDLGRSMDKTYGSLDGWEFTSGGERGSEGTVIRDSLGIAARIAKNHTVMTTQFRPGTSDREMRRTMEAYLMVTMLHRFVHSQRPHRADVPLNMEPAFIWPKVKAMPR